MLSKNLLLSAYEIGTSQLQQQQQAEEEPVLSQFSHPAPVYSIPDGCPRPPSTSGFNLPKPREICTKNTGSTSLILAALRSALPVAFTVDGNLLAPDTNKVKIRVQRINTGNSTQNTALERDVLTRQLYSEADNAYYLSLMKTFYSTATKFPYAFDDAMVGDRNSFHINYLSLSKLGAYREVDAAYQQRCMEETAFHLLMKLALIPPNGASPQGHHILNLMCCLYTSNPAFIAQASLPSLADGLHVYTEVEYIKDILQHGGLEDTEALSMRLPLKSNKMLKRGGELHNSTKEVITRKYGVQMLYSAAAISLAKYSDALRHADKVIGGNYLDLSPAILNTTLVHLLMIGRGDKAANVLKALNIQSLALVVVQGTSLSTSEQCEKLLKALIRPSDGKQQEGVRTLLSQCSEKSVDSVTLLSIMSGNISSLKAYCTTVLDCLVAGLHLCPGTLGDSLEFAEQLSKQCGLHGLFAYDLSVVLMKHYAGLPGLTLEERTIFEARGIAMNYDQQHQQGQIQPYEVGPSGFPMPGVHMHQSLQLTQIAEDVPSDFFLKLTFGCYASYYNEVLMFLIVSIMLGLGFGPTSFRERQRLLQPYSLAASYYLQRHQAYDYACVPLLSIPDTIDGGIQYEPLSPEICTVLQACVDKTVGSSATSFEKQMKIDARRLASECGILPGTLKKAIHRYECWIGKRLASPHTLLDNIQLADCVNYVYCMRACCNTWMTSLPSLKNGNEDTTHQ